MQDLKLTLNQMASAVESMSQREKELVETYDKLKESLEG